MKKFQNKSKNIDEVYQSVFLSYRVTFLCNVLCQIHYTSESPVRYFFMKELKSGVLYIDRKILCMYTIVVFTKSKSRRK